jgi:4-hydroxybenzoate polyprenyltransferase
VLAGAPPELAVRIGTAMTLLQLGIGTVNDVVDAPRDAGHKAGKPIPAGLVGLPAARVLAVGCFAIGTILAAGVSTEVGVLALVVIAIGLAYDLRLKGTPWSWLPFSVGIPILPVFGWVGATGNLPLIFAILLPAAVAAGAGLAVGNSLVDVERDQAAGISSIAVALGSSRAVGLAVVLFAAIWGLAWSSALLAGGSPLSTGGLTILGLVPVAAAALTGRTGPASSARRERLWQVEAIGLAILAAVWLSVVLGSRPSPA